MDWKLKDTSLVLLFLFGGTMFFIKNASSSEASPLEDFPEYLMSPEAFLESMESTEPFAEGDSASFYSPTFTSNIIGKEMKTFHGRTIYGFQGIRYGLKPDNTTRFKPPTPAGKYWENDLTANKIGEKCPQSAGIYQTSGDEDCLFLNVYTPYLPGEEVPKLPVLLFIHGGFFTGGSSGGYLPTGLLDHEIILVTIHYRLGALGFYMQDNLDAPGNAALYDMVEALRWTQKYIGDFGGDKDRVTIFGESAGSVAVNYLMIVEPARGLFSGVIADSGSCLDPWAIDIEPSFAAHFLEKEVGCYEDPDVYNCMANANYKDLVRAEHKLVATDRYNGLMGFRGAAPSIQHFTPTPEIPLMVTKQPRQYFIDGDFSKVPFMTGSNKQEGSLVVGLCAGIYLLPHGLLFNDTYLREQMIPDILGSIGIEDISHSLSSSLEKVYCYDVDLAVFHEATPCMIDMLGVLFLKSGSWDASGLHSFYSEEATYYYAFEYVPNDAPPGFLGIENGVSHGAELSYVFPSMSLNGEEKITTMDRMTKMWSNFAIYGNPTPQEEMTEMNKLGVPVWTEYKFDEHHYMLIESELTLQDEYTDRWTITMEDVRKKNAATSPTSRTTTKSTEKTTPIPGCDSTCQDKLDQRDAFMGAMIAFVVVSLILAIIATYLFFKARR